MDIKILHQAIKGRILDGLETMEIKKAISDNSIKLVNDMTFISSSPFLDLFNVPPTPTSPSLIYKFVRGENQKSPS